VGEAAPAVMGSARGFSLISARGGRVKPREKSIRQLNSATASVLVPIVHVRMHERPMWRAAIVQRVRLLDAKVMAPK